MPAGHANPGERRPRRDYLDWLRGVAVLIMIEAHLLESWTGGADRSTHAFGWAMIIGGLGAPLFLFLAGVSVALSAGAKVRRSEDPRQQRPQSSDGAQKSSASPSCSESRHGSWAGRRLGRC